MIEFSWIAPSLPSPMVPDYRPSVSEQAASRIHPGQVDPGAAGLPGAAECVGEPLEQLQAFLRAGVLGDAQARHQQPSPGSRALISGTGISARNGRRAIYPLACTARSVVADLHQRDCPCLSQMS